MERRERNCEAEMSTFVLVHGAWHGGWCWHKIVARLERAGQRVLAPDMKGHGIDRTPPEQTTLESLADGIAQVVAAQKEKVVLVGHSFGGTIITEVGERVPERIARLVYLAAFVVPNGKSTLDLAADDSESRLAGKLTVAPDGRTATVGAEHLRECFYARCSDDDVALARSLLVPEGLAAFRAPVTTTAGRWGAIASAYIECVEDRAIGISRQRRFAGFLKDPARISLDTDHSPFFSRPDDLAESLSKLG
jgi:pimeloyl-ACP methyl ester carboxylesterase